MSTPDELRALAATQSTLDARSTTAQTALAAVAKATTITGLRTALTALLTEESK